MALLCFASDPHKGAPNTITLYTGCFVLGFGVRQHSQARGSSGTCTHMYTHTHTSVTTNVMVVAVMLVEWDPCVGSAFIWKIWVCVGLFKMEKMTRHAVRS